MLDKSKQITPGTTIGKTNEQLNREGWDWWDRLINGNANANNYEIAQQNLAFQQENLDYQKALQQQMFEREDTSYQRTVEDMRKAGLNPLTMNGTNSAGEAIATEPLHNDMQYQSNGIMKGINDALSIANAFQNFGIGMAKTQEAFSQADIAKANANIAKATAEDKIYDSNLDIWQKQFSVEDMWRNTIYNREFNMFNGMPQTERYLQWFRDYTDEKGKIHFWGQRDKNKFIPWSGNTEYVMGAYDNTFKTDFEKELAKSMSEAMKTITEGLKKGNDGIKKFKGFFGWQ